jgi:hypothetical protein
LHGLAHNGGQIGFAHVGVCRLGLRHGALEDISAYRFFDEA